MSIKAFIIFVAAGMLIFYWPASQYYISPSKTRAVFDAWPTSAMASEPEQPAKDLKWFKDQMGIAPKYKEFSQEVLGMSLPHFIVMSFLVVFFIVALIAVYVRNRRTRHLLMQLVKEKGDEPQG